MDEGRKQDGGERKRKMRMGGEEGGKGKRNLKDIYKLSYKKSWLRPCLREVLSFNGHTLDLIIWIVSD